MNGAANVLVVPAKLLLGPQRPSFWVVTTMLATAAEALAAAAEVVVAAAKVMTAGNSWLWRPLPRLLWKLGLGRPSVLVVLQ